MFRDNGTSFPLVYGVHNSRAKALIAFESTEDEVFDKILTGLASPVPPVTPRYGSRPRERADGRRYRPAPAPHTQVTAPTTAAPTSRRGSSSATILRPVCPDMGHYRFELIDKEHAVVPRPTQPPVPARTLPKRSSSGRPHSGRPLVIGVDPMIAYTCPIQVSDDTDDFTVAGGLQRRPSSSSRQDERHRGPAHAEFVIEFEVDFQTTVFEGPSGPPGYYTRIDEADRAGHPRSPTATTRSSNACSPIVPPREPCPSNSCRSRPSKVPNSCASSSRRSRKGRDPGVGRCLVLHGHRHEGALRGEARQAILAAMGTNLRPKHVVVVDPDIDVNDPDQVEWATHSGPSPRATSSSSTSCPPDRSTRRSPTTYHSTSAAVPRSASTPRTRSA